MIGSYHPVGNTSGRSAPEKPSADDIQAFVTLMAQDAQAYIEEDINPKRVDAIEYYNGRPFGNEEQGRSQVISTDVRDGIQACLPGLLRTFCGSERAMEARPRGAEDERKAEEQTEFANLVYFNDNDGFRLTHDRLLNGLREGFGCAKVWWDGTEVATSLKYTGLSAEDLLGHVDDPNVEVTDVEEVPGETPEQTSYNAQITRVDRDGRIRIEAIPPEEMIVSRTARSLDDALLVGHIREMFVSDVIAMGYTSDQIEGNLGGNEIDDTLEQARNPANLIGGVDDGAVQFAARKVLYGELWVQLDLNGTGRADLMKVCTIGGQFKILHMEMAAERPFAEFVPLPEPHTVFGQSWADLLMDTQRVKSAIRRGMLDSLALTLNPRQVILDGQVELDDVLNTEIGAIIRERVVNATRIQEHRFVGADAFPMLEYEDANAEQRTGRTKAAQGLAADSLQSATKMAVSATVSAAHQRAELLAYIFAESQKKLMKLILKLARRHQQKPRMVRLRGEFVPVDPRNWDVELDFEVAVGLGSGMVEERKAALMEILTAQQAAMEQLGPSNQLTSLGRLRNTLAKLTKLAGYPDADQFWKQVDDAAIDKAAAEAAADPNSKKSPEDKLAEAQLQLQQMKSQTDLQIATMTTQAKAAELKLREVEIGLQQQEIATKAALDREKMILEFEIKKAEIEAKYAADVDMARVKSEFEQHKLLIESQLKEKEIAAQAAVGAHKADREAEATVAAAEKTAEASKEKPTTKRIKIKRNAKGRLDSAEISTE